MIAAVRAAGLVKRYGNRTALHGLDIEVAPGEVFGFLGPNGAGKTTTIRLMLDLIRPTAGTIEVLGKDPRRGGPQLRRRIGYLPGELHLEGRQTAADLLAFLAARRGGVRAGRITELAELLDLDLSRQVRKLSKGNKQKVGIVQAFMHDPALLVLDEPTSGLDPLLQHRFLDLVRAARDDGRTVFMSSHVLSEVQEVADRAVIMRGGRVLATEDVDDLRKRALRNVEIAFGGPVALADFTGLPGVRDVSVDGSVLRCTTEGSADALVKAAARHTVHSIRSTEPDLEEIFFAYYGGRE
nr:ABC transporter ATP-binding protein [Actinorhabdospora filicis]